MHRFIKFIGIIFVLGIVCFLVCDENGISFSVENNQLIIAREVKRYENQAPEVDENIYRYPDFFNNGDKILSYGIEVNTGIENISLLSNNKIQIVDDTNFISDVLSGNVNVVEHFGKLFEKQLPFRKRLCSMLKNFSNYKKICHKVRVKIGTGNISQNAEISENVINTGNKIINTGSKIERVGLKFDLIRSRVNQKIVDYTNYSANSYKINNHENGLLDAENKILKSVEKRPVSFHTFDGKLSSGVITYSVTHREFLNHKLKVLYAKQKINSDFMKSYDSLVSSNTLSDTFNSPVESSEIIQGENLDELLKEEDIDIETLESQNDEFLQKLFERNHDSSVLNLIIDTYLNEYQFVKAKKFIEGLSESSILQLNPLSHLRVEFNSFSLSSQTIIEKLTTLAQNYKDKNQISDEDYYRYKGIIALMQKDYENFFQLSSNFVSERYVSFATKIQNLKQQTDNQKGMPTYYFDTLVAVELFNQGLFQPAKVLALSSLSQNSNYILPYQVLGYANFLTNSWDTAIEYFKKLTDLDSNNAEKYRFLMGIAYYREGQYQQSVMMLSQIHSEDLRLDVERYLIRNYILLDQQTKLISEWSKLLGLNGLLDSDFYTYFYEVFYRPFAEGKEYDIYNKDKDLADKVLRVCDITLKADNTVCDYGKIGKDIAEGNFDNLEQSLLDLIEQYPQGYLYHALGELYLQNNDEEKAKIYLLKAVGMTQQRAEISQIKKLLQTVM